MSIPQFSTFALPNGHIVTPEYYTRTTINLLSLKQDELALLTKAIYSKKRVVSDRFKHLRLVDEKGRVFPGVKSVYDCLFKRAQLPQSS